MRPDLVKKVKRGFTLVELLVVLAISAFLLSVVGVVLSSTMTYTRRMEGSVQTYATARSVFQMLERDLTGAFAYPSSQIRNDSSLPKPLELQVTNWPLGEWLISGTDPPDGRIRKFSFTSSSYTSENTPPVRALVGRWVTALENPGSTDHVRVSYWWESTNDTESRHYVLKRLVSMWDKTTGNKLMEEDMGVPGKEARVDIIARRVYSLKLEAVPATAGPDWDPDTNGTCDGGVDYHNIPKQVKATLILFTDSDTDAGTRTFERTFELPAGQWE